MHSQSSSRGEMRVCLVCHTEPDVWDGGFASIDGILPRFQAMLDTIRDAAGGSPRVAWCLTAEVALARPEPFRTMLAIGHEIGVHSHFPCPPSPGAGSLAHGQDLNRQNLDSFASWFPRLSSTIIHAGFPPPRTHATWMFAYRDWMTAVLAREGIAADCSTCYGGAHHLQDGFLLADSRGRTSGRPYRLSEQDHCREGRSDVVELPVSGGFGSYWEPDGHGGFRFFQPVTSDAERDRQLRMFQARLDVLSPPTLDIFHLHFHLYDFLSPDGTGLARLERARWLLDSMARDPRVRFSTPCESVAAWSEFQPRVGQ